MIILLSTAAEEETKIIQGVPPVNNLWVRYIIVKTIEFSNEINFITNKIFTKSNKSIKNIKIVVFVSLSSLHILMNPYQHVGRFRSRRRWEHIGSKVLHE